MIKHKFVSAKPDLPDNTLINPSDWNDEHVIEPGTIGATELEPGLTLPGPDTSMRAVYALKAMFQASLTSRYAEMTYAPNGDLQSVDVWQTNSKVTKLFTRTLSYTGGDLTSVLTVDESTGLQLTRALTYLPSGDIESITETIA